MRLALVYFCWLIEPAIFCRRRPNETRINLAGGLADNGPRIAFGGNLTDPAPLRIKGGEQIAPEVASDFAGKI